MLEVKNTRYVKTEIDNTPKILHLLSCNLCPFLVFDNGQRISRCAKYKSQNGNNITDSNIYSYSSYENCTVPIKEVLIPDWCRLTQGESIARATDDMYVKDGHNSYKKVPNMYQNLVVMSGLYVEYDLKLTKLISNKNRDSLIFTYNRNRALPERTVTSPATSTTTSTPPIPVPTLKTCSCCGELVEGVNRFKNLGMCPKCWKEHKKNKKIKEFAFINNFRLKRSVSWTDENYKKVK